MEQENKSNAVSDKSDKFENSTYRLAIRPNNYAIKVAILKDSTNAHLPIVRTTGHGSIREYKYLPDVTIEKTSKSVIIYLKKRFVRVISKADSIDIIDKGVKDYLAGKLLEIMKDYPELILDWSNAKLIRREIGVKDPNLRIAPSLRMKDDVFKKVYNNKELEFYNPSVLKRFVVNRTIEDWSPELVKELSEMRQLVQGSVNTQQALANTQMVMTGILKKMVEKESWTEKFGKFIKRIWGKLK